MKNKIGCPECFGNRERKPAWVEGRSSCRGSGGEQWKGCGCVRRNSMVEMCQAAWELEVHRCDQGQEHQKPFRGARGSGWKGQGAKSLGSLTQENGFNPLRVAAGMGRHFFPLLSLPSSVRLCAEGSPDGQRDCGLLEVTGHISCRVRMRAQCTKSYFM